VGAVRGKEGRLRLTGLSALAAALACLAACEHAQPFGPADLGPNLPFSQGFPRQLTFSPLGDLAPAWLPDESGILYSYQRLDRAGHDACLGILPAEGGHLVRSICHGSGLDADSVSALREPAVGPAGLLAYVRESSRPGAPAPRSRELVVATLDAPDPGRAVRVFPYSASDGSLHQTAAYLHWVNAATLVYLAEQVTYTSPPLPVDTLYTPIEVVRLDLFGDTGVVSVVPGTANATSVTVDTAGAIYYTLAGDSRVLRIPPGGGTGNLLFDFEPLGPVRDVQIQGNTLVAVTCCGLFRADLAAHTLVEIAASPSLSPERLALSPSGTRLVVQARDTAAANLWLFQVP
jgi:hypothetical protein